MGVTWERALVNRVLANWLPAPCLQFLPIHSANFARTPTLDTVPCYVRGGYIGTRVL